MKLSKSLRVHNCTAKIKVQLYLFVLKYFFYQSLSPILRILQKRFFKVWKVFLYQMVEDFAQFFT